MEIKEPTRKHPEIKELTNLLTKKLSPSETIKFVGLVTIVLCCYYSIRELAVSEKRVVEPYRLENVRVEKERYPNAWGICGSVRNLKDHSVKGYVEVEFLDSSGKSYFATLTYVKKPDHAALLFWIEPDWIEPGQVRAFECWVDPKAFTEMSDFKVTFSESQ